MYFKFSSSKIFCLFLNETIFTAVETLRFSFPDKWNLESGRVTAPPGAQVRCFLTNRSTFIMGGVGQPRTVLFFVKLSFPATCHNDTFFNLHDIPFRLGFFF